MINFTLYTVTSRSKKRFVRTEVFTDRGEAIEHAERQFRKINSDRDFISMRSDLIREPGQRGGMKAYWNDGSFVQMERKHAL